MVLLHVVVVFGCTLYMIAIIRLSLDSVAWAFAIVDHADGTILTYSTYSRYLGHVNAYIQYMYSKYYSKYRLVDHADMLLMFVL